MILSAHQPVYLPWLGFFHKLAISDLFVIYDNVPYTRYLYYNKNSINSKNGAVDLTVPVSFTHKIPQLHKEIKIANIRHWRKKHWRSIESAYSKTTYFKNFSNELFEIYDKEWDKLIDLNLELIKLFMRQLNINTKIVIASDYNFLGKKSDLVLDMSKKLNASAFIFGKLGADYADIESFFNAGVYPIFQSYVHPSYTQYHNKKFIPYLSVLDLLCFTGLDAYNVLMQNNKTHKDYIEEINCIVK
jgi:hypothetical protein